MYAQLSPGLWHQYDNRIWLIYWSRYCCLWKRYRKTTDDNKAVWTCWQVFRGFRCFALTWLIKKGKAANIQIWMGNGPDALFLQPMVDCLKTDSRGPPSGCPFLIALNTQKYAAFYWFLLFIPFWVKQVRGLFSKIYCWKIFYSGECNISHYKIIYKCASNPDLNSNV